MKVQVIAVLFVPILSSALHPLQTHHTVHCFGPPVVNNGVDNKRGNLPARQRKGVLLQRPLDAYAPIGAHVISSWPIRGLITSGTVSDG